MAAWIILVTFGILMLLILGISFFFKLGPIGILIGYSIAFIALIVVFLIQTISYIVNVKKTEHRIETEDQQEDLSNGGIDEPQPIRDLTQGEKQTLLNQYKNKKFIYDHLAVIIPLFLIFDAFSWYIAYFYKQPYLFKLAFWLTPWQLVVIFKGLQDKKVYLDLESPVFRVAGEVLKQKWTYRSQTHYMFTVRKLEFTEKEYSQLPNIYDSIRDEEYIVVEYSPRTKQVWNINGRNVLGKD